MVTSASPPKFNELEGKDVTAIQLNQLSSAISTAGIEPDKKWFSKNSTLFKTADKIATPRTTLEQLFSHVVNFFGQTGIGTITALVTRNPTLAFNFASNFKDPVSSIIKFGTNNDIVALLKAGGLAGLSGLAAIATSFITGSSPLDILRGILNWTDTVYDFNFDVPDSQIWQQIKSTIDGLYGQAGDFLGSSFARLLLIGTLAPPKVEIDIDGIALAYNAFAEDRKEDLLNGVKNFAWLGIRAAQKLAFLFAFLNGRTAIKQLVASSPGLIAGIDKFFPGLAKALAGWGDEENPLTKEEEVKDWRISTFVENKLEKVKETYGPQIGNFVEQFFEGFVDEIRDGVEEYIEYRFV